MGKTNILQDPFSLGVLEILGGEGRWVGRISDEDPHWRIGEH